MVKVATKAKVKARAAAAARLRGKEKSQPREQAWGHQHVVAKEKELPKEVYLAKLGEVSQHREECGNQRRFSCQPLLHPGRTSRGT
jgi:hypothetical protein